MGYLFRQVWFLCLLSFLLGSLLTWLVMRATRKPTVEVTEERFSEPSLPRTATTAAMGTAAGVTAAETMRRNQPEATGMASTAGRSTGQPGMPTDRSVTPGSQSTAMPAGQTGTPPARPGMASGTTASGTTASGTTASGMTAGAAGGAATGAAAGAAAGAGARWPSEPGAKASSLSGTTKRIVEPGPYPGSARSASDGSAPSPEYAIKGNAQSMLYHTADSPSYRETKAEFWFKTPADAERAGFASWTTRSQSRNK